MAASGELAGQVSRNRYCTKPLRGRRPRIGESQGRNENELAERGLLNVRCSPDSDRIADMPRGPIRGLTTKPKRASSFSDDPPDGVRLRRVRDPIA